MSNWLVVVEPELSYLFPDLRLSIWQLSALLCYVSPFYSLSLIYNSDVAANPNCGFLIPITNLFFRAGYGKFLGKREKKCSGHVAEIQDQRDIGGI